MLQRSGQYLITGMFVQGHSCICLEPTLILFLSSYLGYYLYFEGSLPAEPQQKSCFFSQDLPGGLCQNLTFWYHMLGAGMGELKVLLQDSNGINTTVWQKSGEQGYNWIQARVEIQRDSNYKVLFLFYKCTQR